MFRSLFSTAVGLLAFGTLFASPTNRGYSGAPGSLGRCASSCHGVNIGTVEISGFPTEYVPDSTYLVTIEAVSGLPIKNFNGSVRIGAGSVNAGVISSGTNTSTYTVTQETNGIHLSVADRQSATFSWRAPAVSTGSVTLYVAAHQGARNTGPNTNITLSATEAVVPQLPGTPANPVPATNAASVSINTSLSWAATSNTDYYDVYFGITDPPGLVQEALAANSYALPGLVPATQYYWQVQAFNGNGSTPGPVWTFTTISVPGQTSSPSPANGAENVVLTPAFSWNPASDATSYEVFLGTNLPLGTVGTTTATNFTNPVPLLPGTNYLWRVDATNVAGTATGETWSFSTEAESDISGSFLPGEFQLSPAYPNPFNSSVRIDLNVPQSAEVKVTIFDIGGREVSRLVDGPLSAGLHHLAWSVAGNAAGIYLLKCNSGDLNLTRKLVYLP